jgi:hypothetical protein
MLGRSREAAAVRHRAAMCRVAVRQCMIQLAGNNSLHSSDVHRAAPLRSPALSAIDLSAARFSDSATLRRRRPADCRIEPVSLHGRQTTSRKVAS